MRISGVDKPHATEATTGVEREAPAEKPAPKAEAKAVIVAPGVSSAAGHVGSADEARAKRLEEIAKALNDGSYKVDKDALADKLAGEELARRPRPK